MAGVRGPRALPVAVVIVMLSGLAACSRDDHGGHAAPTSSTPSVSTSYELSTLGAPAPRTRHTAVWTGETGDPMTENRVIVFGGDIPIWYDPHYGGIYSADNDSWVLTPDAGVPEPRTEHTAVWTGNTGHPATANRMIVWGGITDLTNEYHASGAMLDVANHEWSPISAVGLLAPRRAHTAIWTGDTGNPDTEHRMIVWGGAITSSNVTNTGGIFHPESGGWSTTTTTGNPGARVGHTAVWTGNTGNAATANRMIVWGGQRGGLPTDILNSGALYDPATNSWSEMSTFNAPSPRLLHAMVWTGDRLIVFGGYDGYDSVHDGGIYDPATDVWTWLPTPPDAGRRVSLACAWTGTQMVAWGGMQVTGGLVDFTFSTAVAFDPAISAWDPVITAPGAARSSHSAVWMGDSILVWGGQDTQGVRLSSGVRWIPAPDTTGG
jgi:hypothetical protein